MNSTFVPRSPENLSEQVYGKLMSMILNGELAPGDTVNEVSIARELDVSRTPVHLAVRDLIKDGLIQSRGSRRPVVALFSGNEVNNVFEMRHLLELEATRIAATRMDRQTLLSLRRDFEKIKPADPKDEYLENWAQADRRFHMEIAEASGNPYLLKDIRHYWAFQSVILRAKTRPENIHFAVKEHLAILNALEARDEKLAVAAMSKHIREWQRFYTREFEK